MQEIPNWIIKVIEMEKLQCKKCKKKFEVENLMSIAIQESGRPPHKDYLCIGLFCQQCKELIIFELKEMNLIELAFEILDQKTSNKISDKSKDDSSSILDNSEKKKKKRVKNQKSRITIQEVEEVRNFLKPENLLHEEFLMALGMMPEEIKKYNYKK